MRFGAAIGLVFVVVGVPGAMAACSDDIGRLQTPAESKGNAAISKSSGGQAAAAQQEAQHGTGEAAQQSEVAINDARNAATKGDESGCQAALAKARQQLGR